MSDLKLPTTCPICNELLKQFGNRVECPNNAQLKYLIRNYNTGEEVEDILAKTHYTFYSINGTETVLLKNGYKLTTVNKNTVVLQKPPSFDVITQIPNFQWDTEEKMLEIIEKLLIFI